MQAKFQDMLEFLNGEYFERKMVLHAMMAALVGRFHVFLLGGAGVGKSAMVRSITNLIDGARVFTIQMSETNTLEEVIGPIRFSKMKDDIHERLLTDYLADAHLAMLDEIGRSNGPVRNALYTILNERTYKNGNQEVKTPLQSLFTGSNSLLLDAADDAFMDRFLYRFSIPNRIKNPDNFMSLLDYNATPMSNYPKFITLDELSTAQQQAAQLPISDDCKTAFLSIKSELLTEGVHASPRRWRQLAQSLKAFAWLEGASEVLPEHMDWICDGLWRKPEERTAIMNVVGRISNPELATAIKIFDNLQRVCSEVPDTDQSNFWERSSKANFVATQSLEKLRALKPSTRLAGLIADAEVLRQEILTKSKSASSLSMI